MGISYAQKKSTEETTKGRQTSIPRALQPCSRGHTSDSICLPEFDWLKTKYFVFVQQSLQLINQSFNLYTAP